MRYLALAAAAVAAVLVAFAALATPAEAPARGLLLQPGDDYLLAPIATPTPGHVALAAPDGQAADAERHERAALAQRALPPLGAPVWTQRAQRARRQAARPPRRAAWLCIQRFEGAWNDPNPPYYGGLQMDITFQRLYGGSLLRREGDRRSLDAARADVGRGARVPERARLLSLAEHGALLRTDRL